MVVVARPESYYLMHDREREREREREKEKEGALS
jgi:hypothetical protein